jgi:hypothetical protein
LLWLVNWQGHIIPIIAVDDKARLSPSEKYLDASATR